jgi:phage gp29-like protein
MVKATLSGSTKDKNELVSFKLDKKLYADLAVYAKAQIAETGVEMSESQAARKLMLEALKRFQSKKP